MLKSALKYGLIAAALMIAVIVIPFWLQSPERRLEQMGWGEIVGYATMVVALSLIFFALREHRKRTGTLSFRTGLALGLAVTAIAAAAFGLATTGLYYSMGPEETDAFMRAYVEYSVGDEATAEEVARAHREYESNRRLWLNPWFQGFVMFATVALLGIVVSLPAAWLLRTRAASR